MDRLRRLLEGLGLNSHLVLFALLLLVGGIWGFVTLADAVREGQTQRFDDRVLLAFRHQNNHGEPIGPAWLEGASRDVTSLGSVAVLTLVILAVLGYLLLVRKYHAATLVLVAAVGAAGLSSALKHAVGRERPTIVPHLQVVHDTSFPSGHSMMSSAIYLTLGSLLARLVRERRAKIYVLFLALVATFLIGLTRVYLGVHYPTDVLAGWTGGLAWALLCWLVARYLQQRGQVEKDFEEAPTARQTSEKFS